MTTPRMSSTQNSRSNGTTIEKNVNQILALSRINRKPEATAIYMTSSRAAYNAAGDTLSQLTGRTVTNAEAARDRLASAYWQAFWLISVAIAIAGGMVAIAVMYISRFISEPLLRLTTCMHHLAVNDTTIDIPDTERQDEIGDMARAAVVFRNNAVELMRSQRVLAQQAIKLEEQLEQEQRLALLQRNFVSMASHEFRTPLTIIDAHAQRLIKMKDRMPTGEVSERAGRMRSAVMRMTHLMDNLLNFSRLIDGGAGLYFEPTNIDLGALLREVCQFHREMAPGSRIVERFGPAPLPMRGDPKLLFQVFSNLLSNAVKYSPEGGPIEIGAEVSADDVVIVVADRGIGIPVDDLDRLFERYYRGSNVSGIVGTGVGLYLVKMVIDLHRGTMTVDSKEGEGARFIVRLPVRVALETQSVLTTNR